MQIQIQKNRNTKIQTSRGLNTYAHAIFKKKKTLCTECHKLYAVVPYMQKHKYTNTQIHKKWDIFNQQLWNVVQLGGVCLENVHFLSQDVILSLILLIIRILAGVCSYLLAIAPQYYTCKNQKKDRRSSGGTLRQK